MLSKATMDQQSRSRRAVSNVWKDAQGQLGQRQGVSSARCPDPMPALRHRVYASTDQATPLWSLYRAVYRHLHGRHAHAARYNICQSKSPWQLRRGKAGSFQHGGSASLGGTADRGGLSPHPSSWLRRSYARRSVGRCLASLRWLGSNSATNLG